MPKPLSFQTNFNDSFSTPVAAYNDISPIIESIRSSYLSEGDNKSSGMSKFVVYDPYYCCELAIGEKGRGAKRRQERSDSESIMPHSHTTNNLQLVASLLASSLNLILFLILLLRSSQQE
jgi:hypothetical protein